MFLNNRNNSSKIKISKVTDYAASNKLIVCVFQFSCLPDMRPICTGYMCNSDLTYEPRHKISNNVVCATSKAKKEVARTRLSLHLSKSHIAGNHISRLICLIFGPQREKTCLRGVVNNTGADKPAHPRSLISAFVICFLESTICKLATGEISIF